MILWCWRVRRWKAVTCARRSYVVRFTRCEHDDILTLQWSPVSRPACRIQIPPSVVVVATTVEEGILTVSQHQLNDLRHRIVYFLSIMSENATSSKSKNENAPEFNPRWKGYVFIGLSSLVHFASYVVLSCERRYRISQYNAPNSQLTCLYSL